MLMPVKPETAFSESDLRIFQATHVKMKNTRIVI